MNTNKAPDKIFLPRFVYEKWLYQTSDTDDETEVEYIRKEALLEWLNQMLKFSAQSLEFQRNYAYGKVIDKLNEM